MTPAFYKFGRFLFYALPAPDGNYNIPPPDGTAVKESKNLSAFLKKASGCYLLALDASKKIEFGSGALRRMLQIAGDTQAGIIYSDYLIRRETQTTARPLIAYQRGSIRDDFNFGHALLFSTAAVKASLQKYGALPRDPDSGFYDLRLKISLDHEIFHLPEFLYTVAAVKDAMPRTRKNRREEAHFAYVAARNAARQKELELLATKYLKLSRAYLRPRTKKATPAHVFSPVQASIIIPVLNRRQTIADALKSALAQKTAFNFNIIVVDNHSTDGTTDIVKAMAARYPAVQHLIPVRRDLSIGGCWNEAIYSPRCGRFAVQLDSDDIYSSPATLQTVVNMLIEGNYAMVVGSYTIVNEHLKKIPPGLIAHREWTNANGHNNLLRINGLGAPRAFDTAVLRRIGFPNVGYGEDYAVALRISREYKIGRIYKSLYLCRRWPANTDAALSVEKQNLNDFYKDKLRTMEITARRNLTAKGR